MNRKISTAYRITPLIVISVLAGCWCQLPPPPDQVITIPELKGAFADRYIGQTVTVEGTFVRDPVPVLVTDLAYVVMNMPIPEDQYVLLTGDEAERIDPQEFGGAKLRVTGTANAPGGGEDGQAEGFLACA